MGAKSPMSCLKGLHGGYVSGPAGGLMDSKHDDRTQVGDNPSDYLA